MKKQQLCLRHTHCSMLRGRCFLQFSTTNIESWTAPCRENGRVVSVSTAARFPFRIGVACGAAAGVLESGSELQAIVHPALHIDCSPCSCWDFASRFRLQNPFSLRFKIIQLYHCDFGGITSPILVLKHQHQTKNKTALDKIRFVCEAVS